MVSLVYLGDSGLQTTDVPSFDFSAGEVQVRVPPLPDNLKWIQVRSDVRNSRGLMEVVLVMDALNRMTGSKVYLELPYLPYSRQDRACFNGEAFSLSVLSNILLTVLREDTHLTTWDVHSKVADNLFKGKVTFVNRPANELLSELLFTNNLPYPSTETIVVAPDKGEVDRANSVGRDLSHPHKGTNGAIYATKVRNPDNGEILRTEIPEMDYSGKDILIVDDICDGGRTFIELAKVLKERNPKSISLYVTHGIFSKGFDVFEDLIDTFYVANLFPMETVPANVYTLNRQ